MRVVARLLHERRHPAVGIELQLEFRGVEFERAAPAARAREAAVDPVQRQQAFAQRFEPRRVLRPRPLQELAHLAVAQARGRAHHALEEARARDAPVVAHAQLAAQAQPVLLRHQRAQAVRERLGQHWQHAIGEIHRCAPFACLGVEGRAGPNVVADVGDCDDESPCTAGTLAVHGIVVVARILAVDRDERDLPQVLAANHGRVGNARTERRGLGQHGLRELAWQAVRVDGDVRLHARGTVIAEHPQDASDRLGRAARLLRDLDQHDLSRYCTTELGLRHQHAMRDARIVGRQERHARFDLQAADDLARAPLQHLHDRPLRPSAKTRPLHARGDAVAVHHLAHLLAGQVDRPRCVVGQQHAVAVALCLHRADDQAGQLLPQAVLAATVHDDLAALEQQAELRCGVGARDGPEHLRHLLGAHGTPCTAQHLQCGRSRGSGAARRPSRPRGALRAAGGFSGSLSVHPDSSDGYPVAKGTR